jgi:hypothetical protein
VLPGLAALASITGTAALIALFVFAFASSLRPHPPRAAAAVDHSAYTATERLRHRETFRSVLAKQRRYARFVGVPFFIVWGVLVLGPSVLRDAKSWFNGATLIWFGVGVGLFLFGPKLRCPACTEHVDRGFGRFCPECGAPALQHRDWYQPPKCAACGREMMKGKGPPQYIIRACTHCGIVLDDVGGRA